MGTNPSTDLTLDEVARLLGWTDDERDAYQAQLDAAPHPPVSAADRARSEALHVAHSAAVGSTDVA